MSMALRGEFDLRKADTLGVGQPVCAVLLARAGEDHTELLSNLNVAADVEVRTVDRVLWPLDAGQPANGAPDLLLVDTDGAAAEDLDFLRKLKAGHGAAPAPVVALVERDGEYATEQARRAGADAAIQKPVTADKLREVFTRLGTGNWSHDRTPGSDSNVLVFMHVTGGAGATTLAVNIGCALSQAVPHQETCLLDLDIQFGSSANFLDLSRVSPILEFLEDPGRIDPELLEGMLVQHPSGLRVLTSPGLPVPLAALASSGVADLLRVAKSRYRNIVVDLPVALAPWTDTLLRSATVIYLVTPVTVPAAHRVRKFFDLLRSEGLAHLPVKVVVNRFDLPLKSPVDISPSQFSEAIGRSLHHMIPDDYRLISLSQDQGTPAVRMKAKSRFSIAIEQMIDIDVMGRKSTRNARKFGFLNL
ncbi:MAG: hypothetical protein BGN85_10915 [Alphaproteobacteria bacterium 64-11]|nr:hypothetical protein [Alphaproteobacteria bacterium]OJU09391.1 MAG: hypothetical protein BGN85_10915 [Alphaproteobacteria bacterium 64-11]